MRKKAFPGVAILAVGVLATWLGQTSSPAPNVVGYYNVTLQAGQKRLIANQLHTTNGHTTRKRPRTNTFHHPEKTLAEDDGEVPKRAIQIGTRRQNWEDVENSPTALKRSAGQRYRADAITARFACHSRQQRAYRQFQMES